MPRRRRFLQALGLGTVVGVAGCNSDQSPTTSPPETSTSRTSATPESTTNEDTTTTTTSQVDAETVGRRYLEAFVTQKYDAATQLLSFGGEAAIEGAPPTQFGNEFSDPRRATQRAWLALTGQHGPFEEITDVQVSDSDVGPTVTGTLACEEAAGEVQLLISDDGTVSDITFQSSYSAPAYGAADGYREQPLSFESRARTFGGTLTLPADRETAPCVVLLQGSGIFDRDATAGPNRLFSDIAHGLANRGIASYRYDRRRPNQVQERPTIDNLYVDDVVAALERVADTPGVNPDGLFMAGHSRGGMLGPRIAARHGDLSGVALLDGYAYDFAEAAIATGRRLADRTFNTPSEMERAQRRIEFGQTLQEQGVDAAADILNYPPSLLESQVAYDKVETATELSIPKLILTSGQGMYLDSDGSPFRRESFAMWEDALDPDNSTLRYFDDLSHYLQSGASPWVIAEVALFHDNVDRRVIDSLAEWVTAVMDGDSP